MTLESMFMLGLIVGLLIAVLIKKMDKRYLIQKSYPKYRTPMFIEGKFYYIVPEEEYINLTLKGDTKDEASQES